MFTKIFASPNLELKNGDSCTDKVKCSVRHAARSMKICIVLKLRKAFQEVGRRDLYEPLTAKGDTTNSILIQEYISVKHMEQGESGILNQSAPKISYIKMKQLLERTFALEEEL